MDKMFERFVEMAKEEFDCIVIKSKDQKSQTFKEIFGFDVNEIHEYELPYNIPNPNIEYYNKSMEISLNSLELDSTQTAMFSVANNIKIAA